MNYAIVENGVVVNVAVADAAFASMNGWVECPYGGIGWFYENGVFTPPPPPPPPPAPTKEQLLAQLQALQAQINALE